ncbi:MAG: pyridoxamine 5'-phosphate oxidase family protein [Anaerolineales bacterium]|nr:pyridoxamine 5'-phosphate oxidase family protein [Anaerolineales bacterium]
MRWADFSASAPELAAFGAERLGSAVAYIATVTADGMPRVHPVTPILGDELYLFMEPNSPKGKDLQRGSAYSLHCGVTDSSGGQGEFYVRGHGRLVQDPDERAAATAAASYAPAERYILFALSVEFAFMNVYTENEPIRQRWQAGA